MKKMRQRIVSLFSLTFVALLLLGCSGVRATTVFEVSATPGLPSPRITPVPGNLAPPAPAYALAQATVDAAKSQLLDLSRKATEVSQNIKNAANSAALSTQDYNRRQKAELDYQATVVSLNLLQAAATQKFILQQTKAAADAAATAEKLAADATRSADQLQSSLTAQAQAYLDAQTLKTEQAAAALTAYPLTATYAAYLLNITETAQAQAILDAQAAQAALAVAAQTAYPLTATPFSKTQAALLMQQYGREQQSFVDQIVVPLIPILATLDLLGLILVIVLAYRKSITIPWPRRLLIGSGREIPRRLNMIDAVISDPLPLPLQDIPTVPLPVNPPVPPVKSMPHVEIMDAAEPPVAHWIAELEHQMAIEGGIQP